MNTCNLDVQARKPAEEETISVSIALKSRAESSLGKPPGGSTGRVPGHEGRDPGHSEKIERGGMGLFSGMKAHDLHDPDRFPARPRTRSEIGRASCRERGTLAGVAGALTLESSDWSTSR